MFFDIWSKNDANWNIFDCFHGVYAQNNSFSHHFYYFCCEGQPGSLWDTISDSFQSGSQELTNQFTPQLDGVGVSGGVDTSAPSEQPAGGSSNWF